MKTTAHLLLVFFICLSANSLAQQHLKPLSPVDPKKGVIYNTETSFDFRLHTNGPFSIGFNKAKIKTYYLTRFIHVEVGELKHPKENRYNINRNFLSGPPTSSFVYGKQNALFTLRAGLGRKRYYSERARRKGVRVGLSYEAGPVLGFVKPYYLDIIVNESGGGRPTIIKLRYTEENLGQFLNPWNIAGYSGFFKGLNELSLVPGLQAQVALHLEWGSEDEILRVLEMGFMLDAFPKKIPLLIELDDNKNRPFFINLFLNLQLGKRK